MSFFRGMGREEALEIEHGISPRICPVYIPRVFPDIPRYTDIPGYTKNPMSFDMGFSVQK